MGISSTLFEAARGRKPRDLKREVWDCLQRYAAGHLNPKTEDQIARTLIFNGSGEISTRAVRRIIRNLRLGGKLIVSDTHGYWIPVGPEDKELAREYIGKLHDRGTKIFSLIKPQEMAFDRQFTEHLPLEGINI
ncbi:hypothetical protein LCGC14_0398920 [marine sediment metagenome]|uniref:Uncharacterized protein n=1 Tax=marine sediment metagenome TaxID=412755 RepID=A0A0F9VJ70_9ZZZZ